MVSASPISMMSLGMVDPHVLWERKVEEAFQGDLSYPLIFTEFSEFNAKTVWLSGVLPNWQYVHHRKISKQI